MGDETHYDSLLLKQLIEGDTEAFRELYESYQGQVFLFAYRFTKSKHDAEEIVQEVFVKLWEKRGQIQIDKNFSGYIFRMTRNIVINGLRRASIDKKAQKRILENMQALKNTQAELLIEKELERLHRIAINKLAPQQKTVYLLSREEELSYEEIAEKLGISKNTVRNTLVNALKSIREDLSNHPDLACLVVAIMLHGMES